MTIDNRPTKGDDARNRPETAQGDAMAQIRRDGPSQVLSSSGEAICPSRSRVSLWAAIYSLGEELAHMAYGRAIDDALSVLESYGFTKDSEPYIVERFDVTRPKSPHGDAALAMDVLDLFTRGGSFTTGDALQVQAVIGRLLTISRHEREHAGKSEAGRRVAEDKLADMTTDRDALREACERKDKRFDEATTALNRAVLVAEEIVEVRDAAIRARDEYAAMVDTAQAATEQTIQLAKDRTAERDAAAENAKRELNRADWFREALLGVRDDLHNENGLNLLSIADTVWHGSAETTVDYIDAALMYDGSKPRCRVVTSPRFYSDEQREAAMQFLLLPFSQPHERNDPAVRFSRGRMIDDIAKVLGMARAR